MIAWFIQEYIYRDVRTYVKTADFVNLVSQGILHMSICIQLSYPSISVNIERKVKSI